MNREFFKAAIMTNHPGKYLVMLALLSFCALPLQAGFFYRKGMQGIAETWRSASNPRNCRNPNNRVFRFMIQ